MDLNHKRIFNEGNNYASTSDNDIPNSIGLGITCGNPLIGKLSVYQRANNQNYATTAGYFQNADHSYGGYTNFEKKGIWSICNGYSDNAFNIAGDFYSDSSEWINIGIRSTATNTGGLSTSGCFAGQFIADYAYQNIGVQGFTTGTGSTNYGIWGHCPIYDCTDGAFSCSNAAGYFEGDVYTSGGNYYTSDINLKKNIQPLQDALTVINSLEPKSYTYRTSEFPKLSLPTGIQDGLIAQEVEIILPNLIKSFAPAAQIDQFGKMDITGTGTAYKAINYVGIIPYLIGAIKQQQQSLDSLRVQLAETQEQIDNCCESNLGLRNSQQYKMSTSPSTIDVQLTNTNTIILDQNSPNPFSEETFINYKIPTEVSKAVIIIYDNLGQVLKTVTINNRGEGSLHIYAEKLSSGIYTYSLVADGKTIDTKQMIRQN